VNLRCIEEIYKDHGLDLLKVLRKNTFQAMLEVHSWLEQKEDKWTKSKEEVKKVWLEWYAKNVYKTLGYKCSLPPLYTKLLQNLSPNSLKRLWE
jgi:histone deacetylase complex regulatory component SIN3